MFESDDGVIRFQAAFDFGLIRLAFEYKKTPARATAVPALIYIQYNM